MDKEKLNDIVCEASSDYDILNDAYNYIEKLEQQCEKQKDIIDEARECIKNFLCSEDYINADGDAITNNYYEDTLDILKEASK